MNRPSTSKARGICEYYNHPRGCFAGDKCKFLHGENNKLTPFDQAKVCRWYAKGYCRNGDKCWFRHVIPSDLQLKDKNDDNICCICLEKPITYGLLVGCSHVFCIECIRQWRDPQGKTEEVIMSGATKKCPLCRAQSRFLVPSSRFCSSGTSQKEAIMEAYKASMARTPCRYFEETKRRDPFCPFGCDCFYRHVKDDGSPYVFMRGTNHYLRLYAARHRNARNEDSSRTLRFIDRLGATINALQVTLDLDRDDPDSVDPPSDLSHNIFGHLDSSSTEISHDNPDPEVETNPLPLRHADRVQQEARMVLTAAETDEELSDDEILPVLTPLPENLRMRRVFTDEDSNPNAVGVIERSSDDSSNQWFNSRPPDTAIPSPRVLFSDSAEGSLVPTDFEQQTMASQSNNETYTSDDPLSHRCLWCRECERSSGSQSPEPSPLMPVSSLADGTDVESSGDVDAVVLQFGSNGSGENSTQGQPSGPANSTQEIEETSTVEIAVTSGEHEGPAFVTDGRSRITSPNSPRGITSGRSARVRISTGGKTTLGEKPSEDVTGGGFMTDGRGRVIGTSEEIVRQGEDFRDGEAGTVGEMESEGNL